MINNSIYNTVEEFAKNKFGDDKRVFLHMLYAYAKLVSMNESVLDVLFPEKEERLEIAEITRIFNHMRIDVELLKQGAPLVLGYSSFDEDSAEYSKLINDIQQEEKLYSASDILKILLDKKIPELEFMKKGNTIDNVFEYLDKKKKEISDSDETNEIMAEQKLSENTGSKTSEESVEYPDEFDGASDVLSKRDRFQELVNSCNQLYERLLCKIMGQNEAVRVFVQGYFQSEVFKEEEEDRKGPASTFLFAGPPGVGKTYLANTAAELLKLPYLRIDMSEYSRDSSVHTLTGVPKTYASPKKGVLTEFVDNNLRCIVLLDEIEKAHEEVLFQFLQVLDGGVLTDGYTGKTVDFSETILIFTTNVGRSLYEDRDRENLSSLPRKVVLKAIEEEKDEYGREKFPAALCSRFASGNLIMFNHLSVHNLLDIINERFTAYAGKIQSAYDYNVLFDQKLSSMLLFSQSNGMDARNISAQSVILLKNELYEFGRHVTDLQKSLSKLERLVFRVELPEDEKISELFTNKDDAELLFVGNKDDISDIPFSDKCRVNTAVSREEAKKIIAEKEIAFAIIDPMYAPVAGLDEYLSLDDRKSEGVFVFEEIMDSPIQLPVYLLEKEPITKEDKLQFLERGAREFIQLGNPVDMSNEIVDICNSIYLQKKVNELSGRGRILTYNTAQKISKDGLEAEIIFYDFKIKVATSAEENKLLLSDVERPKDRFEDVIGAENAKSELEFFVNYMKNPRKYMMKSVKPPKGILLYGPPGTGKTMLARAMAGECDVSFFPTTAAGFQDKYVGEGEKKIRTLFKTAKKFAPSIIFIDEIDAIGKERTGSTSTHHTETLLNTLLTEMDGFDTDINKPVFVIAATNYDFDGSVSGKSSRMDPALIRRFDNRIYVDLPKEDERKKFLKIQIEKGQYNNITEEAINNLAQRTTGESLAILKNVLELAIRNAGKAGEEPDDTYLLNALEEYMYGEKKEWNDKYYKSVSIHESGHAYICSLSGENPSYVTIVSRGNFGGYMQHANEEDTPMYTKELLLWKIRTSLAGRAAELEFFGEIEGINTGISSDLQSATNLAMKMICRYGMDNDYLFSLDPEHILKSPLGDSFINKVETLLKEEMENTRKLIRQGKDKIEKLSKFLLNNNQATEADIINIFK